MQDITGATARKQLKRSKAASDAELKAGYEESQPFFEEAFDLYQPYAEQGQEAYTRYNQLLGLGTPEERTAAQDTYFSDPAQQRVLDLKSNALMRNLNARGSLGGGQAVLAAGRLGVEGYNSYLDRLQGQGGTGLAATGAQSAIRQGQGDLRYGYGATRAGQETNYGNARAQASTIGVNNLLNIAGTAAKAYTAFSDIRLKHEIEEIAELPSGLPVYSFKYIGNDQPHIGVMAHEAREFFPNAVAMHESGYLTVDYSQIG